MSITLNDRQQKLFKLLTEIPPKLDEANRLLESADFSPKEITEIGIKYTDECFCEVGDLADEYNVPHPSAKVLNVHSTYIYDIISLLLEYGLEPNGIYGEENILKNLQYVDNEYLSADVLALLMEKGGDSDIFIGGDNLFEKIDFDIFFDANEQYNRRRYASLVHYWMVLIAYNSYYIKNSDKISVFNEFGSSVKFDLKKLRSHRNYYFGISHIENDFAISIYDRDTLWEVVRIK